MPAGGEGFEPWQTARAAVREQVAEALGRGERACPACGASNAGARRFCAACGADMLAPPPRRRRPLTLVAAAVVAGGLAVGLAALIADLRASAERNERAAAQRQRHLEAAERRRLRADVRPVVLAGAPRRPGEDPLDHRRRLVAAGEAAITADARERVRRGTLRVPAAGTACSPYPRTSTRLELERRRDVPRGRYQCTAYSRRFELPELEGRTRTGLIGTPYWLVVDYRRARLTFCKITPRAGEGGKSLVVVPVPVPCRDPLRG